MAPIKTEFDNAPLGRFQKRLSFSNTNLDDPRQLEALYNQCREQVLIGEHPVSRETAIRLAAVQCFIEFGPYTPGAEANVKASNLLPKEYSRAKEHEKNIIQEYKDMVTVNVSAAKKKYCKLCTSLPTFGVTFFIVKERESPTEKRLVTRLFGVSKDCVMRVDRKTKTVLKSWPLEQLRRWAASPTTFNIDFGDYLDRYYSAQTLEGEVIKKLIAEYVDIILKKRRFSDPLGSEGDEAGVILEENAPAGRALPFLVENGRLRWRDEVYGAGLLVAEAPAPAYLEDISARSDFSRVTSPPPAELTNDNQFENGPLIMPIPLKQNHFNYEFVGKHSSDRQPLASIQSEQINKEETRSADVPRLRAQSIEETMQQIQQHNVQFEKLKQTAPLIMQHEQASIDRQQFQQPPAQQRQPETSQQQQQPETSQQQQQQHVATSHFITIANDVSDYVSDQNGAFRQIHNTTTTVTESRSHAQPQGPSRERHTTNIPFQTNNSQYAHPTVNVPVHFQNAQNSSAIYATTASKQLQSGVPNDFESADQIQSADNSPESLAAAIESNIRTEEEARLRLTAESVIELLDLPEIVATGADAGIHLNWLIVVGTHAVSQDIGTFVVVIAQIIDSTSPYTAQPSSEASRARQIASAGVVLADLVACIRELAALLWRVSEPVASKLLNKTQRLCEALRLFMEQLHPASRAKRAAILSAASLVGETTCALLSTTSREDTENADDNAQAFYDILNERIQNIASSTANVVLQAKTFLAAAPNRGRLFQCATQVAFTASELIALARVLASVLGSHAASQQRIAESVQRVANTINEIVVEASAQFAQLASGGNTVAPAVDDQRKRYDQLLSTANFANNALHHFLTEVHQSNAKKST